MNVWRPINSQRIIVIVLLILLLFAIWGGTVLTANAGSTITPKNDSNATAPIDNSGITISQLPDPSSKNFEFRVAEDNSLGNTYSAAPEPGSKNYIDDKQP